MKINPWRITDALIIICFIFLFMAGKSLGTTMTGITDFTTGTLTVTSGSITTHGSAGTEPQAAILMFDTSCPSGWTRQSQFDGAIPVGAASYTGAQGGSSTHTHALGSHVHSSGYTVSAGGSHSHGGPANAATSDPGGHTHTQPGSAGCKVASTLAGACAGSSTNSAGGHSHTVTFDATTSTVTHTHTLSGNLDANSDTLDSQSNTPAYVQLVFCKKN